MRNLFALGRLTMYYDQPWGFAGIKPIITESELCALAQAVTMGGEEVQTAAADFEKSVQPLLP